MSTWQLQHAKSHFSAMVKQAMVAGAQYITLRKKPTAVLLSINEYEKLTKPTCSFVTFMGKSPLVGLDLDLERDHSFPRQIDGL